MDLSSIVTFLPFARLHLLAEYFRTSTRLPKSRQVVGRNQEVQDLHQTLPHL